MDSGKCSQPDEVSAANGSQADWTIMLYIAADGNLANFAVESLKQLNNSMRVKGHPGDGKVVVAVQFAIDAPGGQQIPRYIFNECSNGSVRNSLAGFLNAPDDMTEQQALISFLQWVYGNPKCNARRYALILWGHGPELMLQPPSAQQITDPCCDPLNVGHALYMTPQELRVALCEGIPESKRPLSIVGFDACSMSMFEVAYEIQDFARLMVASQEEVPDPSFPYDTLVEKFRDKSKSPEELCTEGVHAYVRAYQDYICDQNTGMKRVALSALRLKESCHLQRALHRLACALWEDYEDPILPGLLLEARKCSRDFAGGLYVDLYDFCNRLRTLLELTPPEVQVKIEDARDTEKGSDCVARTSYRNDIKFWCEKVIDVLADRGGLALANSCADPNCHGVSLYFPYLSEQQYGEVRRPLVKGGTDTIGKGFSMVMNRAASDLLMCVRRQLILDTEGYYEDLKLSRRTGWYRFISKQWAKILVLESPESLDILYSARQSAVNACKVLKKTEDCKLGEG